MGMHIKNQEFQKLFRNDINEFLNEYNGKKSPDFQTFIQLWNQKKLYHILSLRNFFPLYYREVCKRLHIFDYEKSFFLIIFILIMHKYSYLFTDAKSLFTTSKFLEMGFKIILEYLCEDIDLEAKSAALYLLYGLYYHQNIKPKARIQVAPSKWLRILEFVQIVTIEHKQVEYVFRYLLHSDAFEFSAITEQRGLNTKLYHQRMITKLPVETPSVNEIPITSFDSVKNLLEDKSIEEMGMIHEAYTQLKIQYAGPNADRPPRSLDFITENFKDLIQIDEHVNMTEGDNDESSDDMEGYPQEENATERIDKQNVDEVIESDN